MNEIELVRIAVLTYLGYGAVRIAKAPIDAAYEVVKARSMRRLDWIIDNAGVKSKGEPIDVPDRVAFKAMTEGAFTDDGVIADYLGGVLAASGPDDDTGASVVAQIGRLSAQQLRLHYIIYRELRRLWPPNVPLNLYQSIDADRAAVRLLVSDLAIALGPRGVQALNAMIPVLAREGLVSPYWQVGTEGDVMTALVRPTGVGAELFLWGHGEKSVHAYHLFDPDLELFFQTDVPATPGSTLRRAPTVPPETAPAP